MKKFKVVAIALIVVSISSIPASAFEVGIRSVEASSYDGEFFNPRNLVDGNWISRWKAKGERAGAWAQINLQGKPSIGAVVLVDEPNDSGQVAAIRLEFSDGSTVDYILPPSKQYPGLDQPGTIWTPVDEETEVTDPHTGLTHAFDHQTANLEYGRSRGAFFIRFEPRETAFVRVVVTEMAKEDAPASLAQLRLIQVPLQDRQPLASEADLDALQGLHFALSDALPTEAWELSNAEFSLRVSPETGLISHLTSLVPTSVDLTADRGDDAGMVMYVRNLDRQWEDRFEVLRAWSLTEGTEGGESYTQLRCVITPRKYPVAVATVTYRIFPERLDMQVRFTYLVDDWARYRMGFYQRAEHTQWPIHRDSGAWTDTRKAYARAYGHAYDIAWEQGDWSMMVFPLDVIERQDRYLAYGSFDLIPHFVSLPNLPAEGAYPSLAHHPLGLKRGERYTLDLFYKSFPRETSGYMELLEWYGRRTHLEDPAFRGIPVRITQEEPRTMPPGRFVEGARPAYPEDDEEKVDKMEQWMARTGMTNTLYGGWDLWVHSPNDFGPDSQWKGYAGQLSTAGMRRDIAASRRRGIRSYLYINQFVTPPWVRDRLIDPDDPYEREWYIERAKRVFELLEADGFFMDNGWWPISWAPPYMTVSSNPRGSTGKGWITVQALLYNWLKENHPDSHMVINTMSGGTPSQYFTDSMMTEGAGIGSRELVEDTRGFWTQTNAYWNLGYYDMMPPILKRHGLSLGDVADEGLSPELEKEVWERYMYMARRTTALGNTFGGDPKNFVAHESARRKVFPEYAGWTFEIPQSRQMPEFDRFSSLSAATPVVPRTHALKTDRENVFGSVWAGQERLLAAVFNDNDQAERMEVKIDRALIAEFGFIPGGGEPGIRVIGDEGLVVPDRTIQFSLKEAFIILEGELGPKELLLLILPHGE